MLLTENVWCSGHNMQEATSYFYYIFSSDGRCLETSTAISVFFV